MSRYLDKKERKDSVVEDWISQAGAARIRGVSPQAISELIKRGRLTAYTIGGRKFLKRSEVDAFEAASPGPVSKRRRKKRSG
jgi:excisionase family DNA binding protein